MTYKDLDAFVAEYGFDNHFDSEGKPMKQAMHETERENKYGNAV